MNYQDINEEYESLKSRIEAKKTNIKAIQEKIGTLKEQIVVCNGNIASIRLSGMSSDPTAQANLKRNEEEKKKYEENIRALKKELEKEKASIVPLRERVNTEVEKLRSDPETKRHLDAVIQKKLQRSMKKSQKEKDELAKSKFKVESLQQFVKEHPSVANNIKGMITANQELSKLEKELDTINKSTNQNDMHRKVELENILIPNAKAKYDNNKGLIQSTLQSVLKNKGTIISMEDIMKFVEEPVKTDKKGSINLDATFEDRINNYRKAIKKADEKITKNQIALDLVEKPYESEMTNNIETQEQAQTQEQEQIQGQATTKIHWWNFLKRFKAWRGKNNTPALPEPTEIEDKNKRFRDDLKYSIAQDYTKQAMRDLDKQARKIMKNADKEKNDNNEESEER